MIYFFINKSAPFLVNTLCYFYWVTNIKSPAIASGISFPSPDKVIGWLLGVPFSIGTYIVLVFYIIFLPLHYLHFPPYDIIYPCPEHLSQFFWTCWYIPGPIWYIYQYLKYVTCTTIPFPLQVLHFYTFYPPLPWHF